MVKKNTEIDRMLEELIGSKPESLSVEEQSTYYLRRIALLNQTINEKLTDGDDFAIREYSIGESCQEAYEDLCKNVPWFEDGAAAVAASIILSETTKLAFSGAVTLGAVVSLGVLSKAAGAYVMSRLVNYTKLHPEIEPINSFESKTFGILEATAKYNIGFRMANKWNEKLGQTVNVRVWFKSGKPLMCIAYGAKGQTPSKPHVNTEFVLLDNKYKKLEDYYCASAHAAIKMGHPSIGRVVKSMREDWKRARETVRENTKKMVEEAFVEDTFEEHQNYVMEAFENGAITYEDADVYLALMEEAAIDMENNDLLDWS